MTTNNDATRALAKMPEIGTVNKTNVYEWFILHGETIRTALLKSAQLDGLVKALKIKIEACNMVKNYYDSVDKESAYMRGKLFAFHDVLEIIEDEKALHQFSATEI